MKVLICASEGAPFLKTGGLADVIGALPIALKKNGIDVRVMMPYYKKIKEANTAKYVGYAYVRIGPSSEYVGVFHEKSKDDIDYYFIDSDRYFYRDRPYGYGDDGERFAFFDFAVLEALKVVDFLPDVIHCNDWQTGLIPYILKANYNEYPNFRKMKTIYSIHNIQYQGNFPMDIMNILFMPYSTSLEFGGQINFMKAGIMEATSITTVSPTYKDEVLTDQYGYGLNNVLGLRYFDFQGIINGIDVDKFNPQTDKNLYKTYNKRTRKSGKKANKEALYKEFNLDNTDGPLIGLVSRLVDQKGIDLLMPVLDDVLKYSNANLFIVGSGDERYENYFKSLEARFQGRVRTYIGYNEGVAQKIYAASDLFLMPSKFEPCGLGQMIAMRYGSLPIVRETGGLKDTVQAYNQYTKNGSGFTFTNFIPNDLKEVIWLAINLYNDNKEDFDTLIKNAMSKDYSWDKSAIEYIDLYQFVIDNK